MSSEPGSFSGDPVNVNLDPIEEYVCVGSGVGVPDPVRGGVPQEDAEDSQQGKQLLNVLFVQFFHNKKLGPVGLNTRVWIQNPS